RIELGEVESALRRCEGAKDVIVMARENDQPGKKHLVGYVVPREGASLNEAGLRQDAKQFLPEYMIPAAFVILERFLLTPNGKVDRKSLPTPKWVRAVETYVAPRSPEEELLAGAFQQVL